MKARTVSSCLVPMILCGLLAESASASFHLMQIEQVIGGVNGDTTAQAIQLRMRGSLQNLVAAARIRAFDANGLNPITVINIGANVPNGGPGVHVLITSTNFDALTSPATTPDFTMTNLIPASYLAAGSLTFESDFGTVYWRLSWGGASYTGSTLGTINDDNGDFGPPYPNPLPSGSTQALLFQGSASALSTTNAADYTLTRGSATFTNNAGASFTTCCETPGIFVQPPSAFPITTDGLFTDGQEWSDVDPAIRLDETMFVYTATDPGQEALYLMYDKLDSLTPLGSSDIAGPVHFHNDASTFEVYFAHQFTGGVLVLKDGAVHDTSDPAGGEASFSGALGFGTSPNSAARHNMFELEVLFTATMPNGHSHGQYSPDPSHWGADLPRQPAPDPQECIVQPQPIRCFPTEIPPGAPEPSECPPFPPQRSSSTRVVFGEASSNACVDVDLDGTVTIETIPICNQACVQDIDGSGDVRVPDLIKLLSCWGPLTGDPDCACLDIDGSGDIRVPDLIAMLAKWGVCP